MTEFIELTTTAATEEESLCLARLLIDQRLACCVQISGPIRSVYRWQDQRCEETEFLLSVKSLSAHTSRLMQVIRQAHSYDTPQIVVMPVVDCEPEYALWWRQQVDPPPT